MTTTEVLAGYYRTEIGRVWSVRVDIAGRLIVRDIYAHTRAEVTISPQEFHNLVEICGAERIDPLSLDDLEGEIA